MIKRESLLQEISASLKRSRVVALLGPRQCGKTTLARQFVAAGDANYFDLEDPRDTLRLETPMTTLEPLRGTVVIDEIQRLPELFPVLRVLADRKPPAAKFLILGSASPELFRNAAESLAGRVSLVEMGGFSLDELTADAAPARWLRGGFPLSFLAGDDDASFAWRRDFSRTFIERDARQFFNIPATTLSRFWAMLAHYHGQIWNAAELARSLAVSEASVRRYLDLLSDLFMVRQLPAWHANLKKRQVRAPKIYFRDTGLLHCQLGIRTPYELSTHPRLGASWEGWAVEEAIRAAQPDGIFFWATHEGAEIDLVLVKRGRLLGVECKYKDMPRVTPSMRIALGELGLERIAVLYPGGRRAPLHDKIEAVPLAELSQGERGLFG